MHNGSEHRLADAEYERLSALLDERLPPDERQELIAHLEQCITCRNELAALRQLQMLLQQVPPPALPRSFTLPLDTPAPLTLQASSIRNRSRRHINSWLRGIGAVAAVIGLLILITGLVTIPHGGASMAGSGAVTNSGTTHTSNGAHATPAYQQTPITGQSGSSSQSHAALSPVTPKNHAAPVTSPPGISSSPSHTSAPPHATPIISPTIPAEPPAGLLTPLNAVTLGSALVALGVIALIVGTVLQRRGPPARLQR